MQLGASPEDFIWASGIEDTFVPQTRPGHRALDWSWTDEVLPYLVEELGITPIIDLMHYGCPFWLRREFANEDYPRAVAAYAAAFARRYAGRVRWYTPLNEPLVH